MADSITSLRLRVDSTDVVKADKDLNHLATSSSKLEGTTQKTSQSFLSFNKILAAGAVLGVAAQYIKLADTMTSIQSKLKLVTSSTQELTTAQSELFKIAQKTRQGFAETVDTYSNFAIAMGEMGKSQKDILRVTETVNKAIAISGGTAQQAAAATMQLGQAFASGVLRGDELNSILENSKGLAQAIADGMGVPIGKLRTLGAEGKITAEILAAALEKSAASVDEKFGKVGVTVSASMETVSNALLMAVGEMDNAVGASSLLSSSMLGLGEVFTTAANALHNFNIEISRLQDVKKIKSLEDANTALKQIDDEIAGLTTSTDLIDRMGRSLNGEIQNRAKLNNLYAARASLNKKVNVIAEEELKIQDKAAEKYKNRPARDLTKEELSAAKKAEALRIKLAEEEAKIQRGYLEGYADLQANQALEDYNNKLSYLNDYADLEAQAAIEQYNIDQGYITDLAQLQTNAVLSLYELTLSDADKINEKYMELNDTAAQFFDEETLTKFYAKWQEEIDNVKSNMDFSASIEFDPAGLEGTAKAIAGISKSMDKLSKAEKQYNTNKNKAGATSKELAKNEEEYNKNQIAGYSNLAGSMSNFFEEGTAGAKAFQTVQAGLAVVNAVSGIAAQAALPFPYNIAAMASTAATVFGFLSSAGLSGGGGGGGTPSISASTQSTIDTSKYGADQANLIVDRLDRQIELLESIDQGGTAAKTKVALAGSTFELDISKLWAEIIGSTGRASAIPSNMQLTGNTLTDVQASINLLQSAQEQFTSGDWQFLDLTRGDILGFQSDLEKAISDFAINLSDVKNTVKDSADGFKEIYDSLSRTDFYKMRDLEAAYKELGNSIVGNSKDSMLSYISSAVSEMERLGSDYIETTKDILKGGTVDEQVASLKQLSAAFNQTFNNSTEDALNFLDSIELVANDMVKIGENTQTVFSDIRSFIDELIGTTSADPSVTFYKFTSSFNDMVDAISNGSIDMIEISGKTIENAKDYLNVVTATATSSRDIQFAKSMLINKFSGVIATPDTSLGTINDTLRFSLGESGAIAMQLQELKDQVTYLNDLNTTNTATNLKILSTQRSILGETATA